jgi:hypothetical protein
MAKSNLFLSPFKLLFLYKRNKVKQSALSQVTSLKTIKGAMAKHPSPRAMQAKNLVANVLNENGKTKATEAKS